MLPICRLWNIVLLSRWRRVLLQCGQPDANEVLLDVLRNRHGDATWVPREVHHIMECMVYKLAHARRFSDAAALLDARGLLERSRGQARPQWHP